MLYAELKAQPMAAQLYLAHDIAQQHANLFTLHILVQSFSQIGVITEYLPLIFLKQEKGHWYQ